MFYTIMVTIKIAPEKSGNVGSTKRRKIEYENRMEKQEQKQIEPKYWHKFPENTLTLKIVGSLEQIETFSKLLKRIYKAENLCFSAIKKNLDDTKFHCFVNILPSSNEPKSEEEQQ